MKKLTLLFFLPLLFTACNSIEKYRAPIDEVAKMWSETTKEVTTFSDLINSTISQANNATSEMTPSPEQLKEAGEEVNDSFMGIKTEYMEALKAFTPIQNQLGDLMKNWGEKTSVLTGLTEGLAAGKLEGDIMSKVTDLKQTATDATESLSGMRDSFQGANSQLTSTVEKWKAMYAQIVGE